MKYKNQSLNSFYSPFLTLDSKSRIFINNKFILPKINDFFKEKQIHKFKELNDKYIFSDILFKDILFESLYEEFFDDFIKENDSIQYMIKYSITFNKNLVNLKCEKTNIIYSELLVFNQPIFYLIYIDSFDNVIKEYEKYSKSLIKWPVANIVKKKHTP